MSDRGLYLQTTANSMHYSPINTNIAIGYTKYVFNNNKTITLSRNNMGTKILPQCIIFNIENSNDVSLDSFKNCINHLHLHFKIGAIEILKIPLILLWNFKQPQVIDDKLYLSIPFDLFFGDIHICGLHQQDITFQLVNPRESAYIPVTGASLLCKTCVIEYAQEHSYTDTSGNVVQVSSIEINVDSNNPHETSNEFRVRTNNFCGFVKGFFIEASQVSNLESVQFYMNECLRIDFDKYMIENICVKINENMIYVPFNPDISYDSTSHNSFYGSLNIDRLEHTFLNLKFSVPIQKVRVYSFNKNIYTQRGGIGMLQYNYQNVHLVQDFAFHTLTPIEDLLRQYLLAFGFHSLGPIIDLSLNDVIQPTYISQTLNRPIQERDHSVCPIRQTQIQSNEKYMLCNNCSHCYNEYDIIQWFQTKCVQNVDRTCPTCRQIWSDFNVYINSNL